MASFLRDLRKILAMRNDNCIVHSMTPAPGEESALDFRIDVSPHIAYPRVSEAELERTRKAIILTTRRLSELVHQVEHPAPYFHALMKGARYMFEARAASWWALPPGGQLKEMRSETRDLI